MSYLEKAIALAVEKHKGQKDKAGMPYILHPLHVMSKMNTETEKIIAILHDIIEDTDCTLEYLDKEGFSQEILNALECLTHVDGEDYFDYIKRVKNNSIAVKVKIADLEHNMDLRRLKGTKEADIMKKIKRYKKAWDELQEYIKVSVK